MPASDFDAILTECLERLASGESVAACLARYPQHAPQLGPTLTAAESLRQLGSLRMPDSSRLRAQARMRRALVDANGKRTHGAQWWTRGWFRGLAGLVAVLALALALTNVLAASRPGDWGYPLRAAAERLPAQWIREPELRVSAELRVADHRLLDLERAVTAGSDALDPVLAALLVSDEAAAQVARALPEEQRAIVASQIANHAEALGRLSRVAAGPEPQTALAHAATQLAALAAGLVGDEPQPGPALTPVLPAPTVSPGVTWRATLEPKRPAPTRTPASPPTPTPAPTATARPIVVTPTAAPPLPTATASSGAGELATPEDPGVPQPTTIPPSTDDHGGSGSTPQPTDDHGGSGSTPEPTDDHGGSGSGPRPTDDRGGSGGTLEPTDDHSGSGRSPDPTEDHSGRGGGSDKTPEPDDGRS